MNWYYSQGNERLGPVPEDEWRKLIASGEIKPETLVWREGMPDWLAFSKLPGGAGSASGGTSCAECGKTLPPDELVPIGGRQICPECKPLVLQRLKEGAPSGWVGEDPEALTEAIRSRGYDLRIGSCFSRSVALVKSRFWLAVGTTLILYLVMGAASAIPCIGIVASMVVNGPVLGGLYWFFLKLIREGDATIGDGFEGFSRQFVQLMLCTIVSTVLIMLCFIPAGIFMVIGVQQGGQESVPVMAIVAYVLGFLPAAYLGVAWMFALPLIIDKRFDFWPAMEASRRVVNLHWWKIFGLLLVFMLVMMGILLAIGGVVGAFAFALKGMGENASAIAAIVGGGLVVVVIFCIMPVFFGAIVHAYEDIFGTAVAAKE